MVVSYLKRVPVCGAHIQNMRTYIVCPKHMPLLYYVAEVIGKPRLLEKRVCAMDTPRH